MVCTTLGSRWRPVLWLGQEDEACGADDVPCLQVLMFHKAVRIDDPLSSRIVLSTAWVLPIWMSQ